MQRLPRLLVCLFLVFAVSLGSAYADEPLESLESVPVSDDDAAFDESSTAWFVELASPPVADGGSLAATKSEKQAFRSNAKKAGLKFAERYSFDTLFNGLSIVIKPTDYGKLSRIAGVKALWPVVSLTAPEPQPGDEPELITALAQTQADIAQNTLGLTGAGIKVGIIDTGVDFDHPDLGSCFGAGCRVAVGYDFVGDAYNNDGADPAYNPIPTPDAFPDDCNGHGTHVAGIVGANGGVKGVAPGVTFGAYRVFGCAGSTSSDIMIAAMERALADGMNVINMSIGASYQWPEYPTAKAGTRLVNKGVTVVCSIGNSGANGLYAASAPGVGDKVIGVANFINTHINQPYFTISPDDKKIVYGQANGALRPPVSGTSPMARTGTQTSAADACNASAPAPGSLTGRVALIRRGTCGFHEKVVNAQNAGAIGVVIYNNIAGSITPNVAGAVPITIPVVPISAADGNVIDTRLAAGPVDMTWTSGAVSTPNSSGNLISASSSWGVTPDLILKPDIGAPGGNIRSTVPIEQGSYALLSGTSMASPHVAGAAALLLQAQPNTPAQAVGRILQVSAQPKVWSGNPALGFLELTHRQGAGMLRIADAITATTRIEPGKLSLGEIESGSVTRTLMLKNLSGADVTYDLGHQPALATGPATYTPAFFNAPATMTFSILGLPVTSVLVPANSSASVEVNVTPNGSLASKSLFGGYVVFAPQGGGQTHRVPYTGFKGDYQSIQVLLPTTNVFPWLAKYNGTSFVNQPGGASYTMIGNDIPFIVLHLDHQARRLRVTVEDATTAVPWHRAIDTEYLGRNSGAATFFSFSWDGQTVAGKKTYTVPNGTYVLKLSVLKALGDESNPAHWETWTSPAVTVARP